MRRSPWRLLAALLVSLLAAACADLPTTVNPDAEMAQLGFALDLSATDVSSVSVQVTAPDISYPLVYNIPVANGTASGWSLPRKVHSQKLPSSPDDCWANKG